MNTHKIKIDVEDWGELSSHIFKDKNDAIEFLYLLPDEHPGACVHVVSPVSSEWFDLAKNLPDWDEVFDQLQIK